MTDQSLNQLNTRRYDVPIVLALAFACLVVGLSLPFMKIQQLVFWHDEYSLISSIKAMWGEGHHSLALLIFFFSIIFPFGKLLALVMVWYRSMSAERRDRVLHWLSLLGKWSMLDVFVIAVLIVLTQSKGYVDAEAQAGLYIFAVAILLSMTVSLRIEHLAKKSGAAPVPPSPEPD